MKALRRLWHRRRIACLRFEIATLEHERLTHGVRMDRALRALAAARWDLDHVDRARPSYAPGNARRDGKLRSITTTHPTE